MLMVCRPGSISWSTTTSTTPPWSACTVWWTPFSSTSTSADSTGTRVNERQPREPVGSPRKITPRLENTTRPSTRTQRGEP